MKRLLKKLEAEARTRPAINKREAYKEWKFYKDQLEKRVLEDYKSKNA